mmetsp:Transcript_14278/g.37045  ORF Transcript_14278/g.37045 Transcript_14278/m.37045 type:complete len:429 (-) Transcript_14278:111-1397(-)
MSCETMVVAIFVVASATILLSQAQDSIMAAMPSAVLVIIEALGPPRNFVVEAPPAAPPSWPPLPLESNSPSPTISTSRALQLPPPFSSPPPPLPPLPKLSSLPVPSIALHAPVVPNIVENETPQMFWDHHANINCWTFRDGRNNGARMDLEQPIGSAAPGVETLEACKRACVDTHPPCQGIIYEEGKNACYRRSGIYVIECHSSPLYNLYILQISDPPSPPLNPSPPQPPPGPPAATAASINMRFRNGRPSNDLQEAGLLVHQFDGLEDWQSGGFRPCRSGWCNNRYDHTSFSLINQRNPVTFNRQGGVILASYTPIACSYAGDGGTQSINIEYACSLTTAFGPNNLKGMLQTQEGSQGKSSNYNEVVVPSRFWDAHLPFIVEAVFYIDDDKQARAAYEALLRTYNLTTMQIPLLRYDYKEFHAVYSV